MAGFNFPLEPDAAYSFTIDVEERTLSVGDLNLNIPILIELDALGYLRKVFVSSVAGDEPLAVALSRFEDNIPYLWLDECALLRTYLTVETFVEGELCLLVGRKSQMPIALPLDQPTHEFTADDLADTLRFVYFDYVNLEAYQRLEYIMGQAGHTPVAVPGMTPPENFPGVTILSAGFDGGRARIRILTHAGVSSGKDTNLSAGFNLIGIRESGDVDQLDQFFSCDLSQDILAKRPWLDIIQENADAYVTYALVVEDSGFCGSIRDLDPLVEGLPLKNFSELQFRKPYVAVFDAETLYYEGSNLNTPYINALLPGTFSEDILSLDTEDPFVDAAFGFTPMAGIGQPPVRIANECIFPQFDGVVRDPDPLPVGQDIRIDNQSIPIAPGNGFWSLEEQGAWFGSPEGKLIVKTAGIDPNGVSISMTGVTFNATELSMTIPAGKQNQSQHEVIKGLFDLTFAIDPSWVEDGYISLPMKVTADVWSCPSHEDGVMDSRALAFFLQTIRIQGTPAPLSVSSKTDSATGASGTSNPER